ncbi:MAG: hypothetical protein A2Z34_05015 [Planctomycetes bacterium RBG_16_59_8]|nr:MAG: hypothetical protein A2Z34_05015 [Planctomycetes bacterium RBG_16_59_8]
MASDINVLLTTMAHENASDLFLKVGVPPAMRVVGKVATTGGPPLTTELMAAIYDDITSPRAKKLFEERGEADISYEVIGAGRFRANIFRQRGSLGIVFRHVKSRIPTLDELNLPTDQLTRLAKLQRGLVLVTGTAGSGKSTTIAAMIDYVNHNFEKHVITVEDPIEFTFTDDRSVIEQREIGQDTESFGSALKSAVRQSPDIIMLGEMRDKETVEAALNAAETGHLVFSTLHTVNAVQTVERIINFFPPYQHDFLKLQMSQLLEGAVSQRLIQTQEGDTRIPAVEILVATPTVRELLMTGKTREIYKALKEGKYYGTQTFNQSLMNLLSKDLITLEDALLAADSPDELKIELRGISKDTTNYTGGDTTKYSSKIVKGF